MALINCPECGKEISDKANACIHCGFPLSAMDSNQASSLASKQSEEKKTCINCGSRVSVSFNHCPNCGYDFGNDDLIKDNKGNSYAYNVSTHLITCPGCGKRISKNARTCPSCGEPIDSNIYCPKCGSSDTKVISGASKVASVALWGPFAAHKVLSHYVCKKCGHKF